MVVVQEVLDNLEVVEVVLHLQFQDLEVAVVVMVVVQQEAVHFLPQ